MPSYVRRLAALVSLAVVATLGANLGANLGSAQAAAPSHGKIVSAVPEANTPAVNDGEVDAITRVGDVMVIGGTFTSVSGPGGAATARSYVAAFDAKTGTLVQGFNPALNGAVTSLEAGPTPGTVYVGGRFTSVGSTKASHVALLDLTTGAPVAGFKAAPTNGVVNTMVRRGDRLFIGGFFTTADAIAHAGLATLNVTTGAVDSYVNNQTALQHNTGTGAKGPVGVRQLDIAPAGDRLIAIGNFRTVDGLDRDQVVMLTLGESGATVTEDWQTNRYKPLCFNWSYDSYVRGVDFAPSGDYFVLTTTGGGNTGTLCDSAARFETYGSGVGREPTWVDYAGGDTLWAVEVTEKAVYVGGHQRWMNNSLASDRAGAGAVARPGIAALDTDTGVPLKWNPGRNPRGAAVFALYADQTGLWVGSDTEYIGDRLYRRPRLAKFDLASGAQEAPDNTASLPGRLFVGGRSGNSLTTAEFTGSDPGAPVTTGDMGLAWGSVRGGAFLAGGYLYYGWTDNRLYRRTFTGSSLGASEAVTPYINPLWDLVLTGSGNTYKGAASNFHNQLSSITGMAYHQGRIYYTRSNQPRLYWRWFNTDSGIVGSDEFTAGDNGELSTSTGLVIGGGKVFYAARSGNSSKLQSQEFTGGRISGTPTTISTQNYSGRALFLASADAAYNEAPKAKATATCTELTCSFDGSTSTDADGTISSYAWDFGDGETGTGATVDHTYATPGTRTVKLTVTDNVGATHSTTVEVSPIDPVGTDISFVDAASVTRNVAQPTIGVPAGTAVDDTLVLTLTVNNDPVVTTPAGWTLLDRRATTGMTSYVWTRRASDGDAGTTVTVDLGVIAKSSLSVMTYRGVDAANPIAGFATATDASTVNHTSPQLTVPEGSWVITYYAEKGPSTSGWTPPAGAQRRAESFSTGTTRVSSLLVDGGGAQGGTVGGLVANTDAASTRAIAWTIALRP